MNEYNGWEGNDRLSSPKDGLIIFLENLSKSYDLYIFSTRDAIYIVEWLIEHKLREYFKGVTNIKGPAYAYIDDRAIRYNGDYSKTIKEIKNFKPYWK